VNHLPALTLVVSAALAALVGSYLLVWAVYHLALRARLIDVPNERSSHTRATPRGGGKAIVAVVCLGFAACCGASPGGFEPAALAILLASLGIALISLIDDFRPLPSLVRLACHLTAAGAVVWLAGPFTAAAVPFLGVWAFGWLAVPLSVVWLVGLTNVYNFMDGIDGIAGGQGVVAGLAWAGAGLFLSSLPLALLGVLLAGSCAGFLLHNWQPARIFMGDVGSAFLGFWFAALLLLALGWGPACGCANPERLPVFAVMVVFPFVGDGLLTFLRRAIKRENVLKAHRSHLYQRLVISGWSHARVSALYTAWAALCAGAGFAYLAGAPGAEFAVIAAAAGPFAALYAIARARTRA
jgi:UDP-N-acetylmuramyl pentapeptide phosphotransferase/UDP-N-acetylglucosamine-1-phosphate transferase